MRLRWTGEGKSEHVIVGEDALIAALGVETPCFVMYARRANSVAMRGTRPQSQR
jgi:hypothetical protein